MKDFATTLIAFLNKLRAISTKLRTSSIEIEFVDDVVYLIYAKIFIYKAHLFFEHFIISLFK